MIKQDRLKRKMRVRGRISGTETRPRLSVYRSNTTMYAQTIDDVKGVTLAEAHGIDSVKVGAEIAKKMLDLKRSSVVFDRNGYIYHGRVKALADAAREGGLVF